MKREHRPKVNVVKFGTRWKLKALITLTNIYVALHFNFTAFFLLSSPFRVCLISFISFAGFDGGCEKYLVDLFYGRKRLCSVTNVLLEHESDKRTKFTFHYFLRPWTWNEDEKIYCVFSVVKRGMLKTFPNIPWKL